MRGDGADENSVGHPSLSGSDSRRRITTKREPREVRDEQASTTEQFREGSSGKRRRKSAQSLSPRKRHWTSIPSAGALDITHCDFSARSARDDMRHIIGSSEPDVIILSDKDWNRRCRKKDKDHMEFLCELYEQQVARGTLWMS